MGKVTRWTIIEGFNPDCTGWRSKLRTNETKVQLPKGSEQKSAKLCSEVFLKLLVWGKTREKLAQKQHAAAATTGLGELQFTTRKGEKKSPKLLYRIDLRAFVWPDWGECMWRMIICCLLVLWNFLCAWAIGRLPTSFLLAKSERGWCSILFSCLLTFDRMTEICSGKQQIEEEWFLLSFT